MGEDFTYSGCGFSPDRRKQAGQSATFTVPAVGIAGHEGYVYAALPTGQQSANAPQSFLLNGQRTVQLTTRGDVNTLQIPVPSLSSMLNTGRKVLAPSDLTPSVSGPS